MNICFINMLLNEYINFSIKYKLLVKDNLNQDIKHIIWKFYIKDLAIEFIKKFIKKNIYKCNECLQTKWKLKNFRHNFYSVNGCNHMDEGYEWVPHCSKTICVRDCKFKIKCNNCNIIDFYIPERRESDIGWNPIEGKEFILFNCKHCNSSIKQNLIWNN